VTGVTLVVSLGFRNFLRMAKERSGVTSPGRSVSDAEI
jgi:hypothetical protein